MTNSIATTARIMKNVELGENAVIGDFVIIGFPPKGRKEGELKTTIGDNAVIRSHTVIYAGTEIGDNFQSGHHTNIREENSIGNDVSIGTNTVVEFKTKIADNARIHSQAFIPEYCELHEGCWVGPNVVLTNARFPGAPKSKESLRGPTICKDAKVGANSTILPGVKIGRNALVGAGSVVTRDVPDGKVAAGNPAKIVGDVYKLRYPTGEKVYE